MTDGSQPANPQDRSNDSGVRPLLELKGITKHYGRVAALDGLELGVRRGEFFALLGPSGCGKTTLLRLIAGFETLTRGQILLDGEDLGRVPPYRRPVNMMFQSYALFPHLSVEQNIAFGLKQEGMPRPQIDRRVDEMLSLVKLQGLSRRKPSHLSGGERQRVALARSLAKRPKVLLLDEPMAALDKKLRAETQFELMDLQASLGTTFVIVTHDQEEAMKVADRIAVMQAGRIAQVGTPAEVYERPNSRYVADFVGDVNLMEGRLAATSPAESLVDGKIGVKVRVVPPVNAVPGATVWLALRPEKIRLSGERPAEAGENAIEGTVVDVGYLGNLSMYKVRLDGGEVMKACFANHDRFSERPVGDKVWLSWTPEAPVLLTR